MICCRIRTSEAESLWKGAQEPNRGYIVFYEGAKEARAVHLTRTPHRLPRRGTLRYQPSRMHH